MRKELSMHEKDAFGDKLKDKERGEEEQFFAQRERALLEKLRARGESDVRPAHQKEGPRCPKCGSLLAVEARADRAKQPHPPCH